MVQIDHDDREGAAVASGFLDRLPERFIQTDTVGNPGEVIGRGEALELLVGFTELFFAQHLRVDGLMEALIEASEFPGIGEKNNDNYDERDQKLRQAFPGETLGVFDPDVAVVDCVALFGSN